MAFTLKPDGRIGDGLARVARKTLTKAIGALVDTAPTEAIHAARKSTKKVRALLALVEKDVRHTRRVEKRLRRISRQLSPLRDAHALVDTFARVSGRMASTMSSDLADTARALKTRAERVERAAIERELLTTTRRALKRTRRVLDDLDLDRVDQDEVAAAVKRAYRRGRHALGEADRSGATGDFHRWRKRVKTLWYHARLLEPCLATGDAIETLGHLEEWLGEDHNIAVLLEQLAKTRRRAGTVLLRAIERSALDYRTELRRKAVAVGERFFADAPSAFVRRLVASHGRGPQTAAA